MDFSLQPLAFSLLLVLASALPCAAADYEKEIRPVLETRQLNAIFTTIDKRSKDGL